MRALPMSLSHKARFGRQDARLMRGERVKCQKQHDGEVYRKVSTMSRYPVLRA